MKPLRVSTRLWVRLLSNAAVPHTDAVSLGKLLHLSVPQFPRPWNGDLRLRTRMNLLVHERPSAFADVVIIGRHNSRVTHATR